MAPTKLYRNPVVVEVGLVFVWPGYRRCLLWKKKGSLGSKAPGRANLPTAAGR
jgi:hypothetical protein